MSIVADAPSEVPLVAHSRVTAPIREMDFPQRSLLFAELALVAYNEGPEATAAAARIGFPDVTLFDRDGSQAYRFRNDHDCVIACRGTESNQWNDIRADVDAAAVVAETVGKVHRGFKTEVDDLWPMLETALASNELDLWFCGHSLGGAMATICAGRCYLSHIDSIPVELYSYGSPRVGNRRYINYVPLAHYRFVNNNDLVARVPPALLGYRHSGSELYIDRHGRIGPTRPTVKMYDRLWGFLQGLRKGKIDHLADHSLHRYIAAMLTFDPQNTDTTSMPG